MDHKVVSTSNGSHPPGMWAQITTQRIGSLIEIDSSNTEALIAKTRLEAELLAIFLKHHSAIQASEKEKLNLMGHARALEPFQPFQEVEAALVDVLAAMSGTIFLDHFSQEDVKMVLRTMIGSDFATQMDIERGWFCAVDREHPQSREYFTRKGQ